MANFTIFGPFGVVFVFLTHFYRFFGGISNIFWTLSIMGGDHGSTVIFALFPFFNFLGRFWILGPFLGFWLQWRFGAFLGVLVSYKIPRGIRLVVWRVFERLWGFLGGLGGSGGVKGTSMRFCSTPIWHYLPLWKSCRRSDWVPNTT